MNPAQTAWLRASALAISRRASVYDAHKSKAAWMSWIQDGPAKSTGRHHRLSRVSTGWIPSSIGIETSLSESMDCESEDDEKHSVLEEELRHVDCIPLASQAEVDMEATKWMAE